MLMWEIDRLGISTIDRGGDMRVKSIGRGSEGVLGS
jgi:hypothetical protein